MRPIQRNNQSPFPCDYIRLLTTSDCFPNGFILSHLALKERVQVRTTHLRTWTTVTCYSMAVYPPPLRTMYL